MSPSIPSNNNVSSEIECAVLCIDLRDATKYSVDPTSLAKTEVRRLETMYEMFKDVVGEHGVKPTFVKSTGDGLMCFWMLNGTKRPDRLKSIALIALDLNALFLGDDLRLRLGVGKRPQVGLGLAFGPVAKGTRRPLLDYFGYAANIASKLQDRARPSGGLVVQGAYIEELGVSAEHFTKQFTQHDNLPESLLYEYGVKRCYVSDSVQWKTDWTCVAWPGFASVRFGAAGYSEDQHPFGLNEKGVTVLTHEGLRGKLGTLEIWERHAPQAQGDCFEIIIDDFDALAAMSKEKTLSLKSPTDVGKTEAAQALTKLCPALTGSEAEEGFLFIPIRCGINSILWNSKELSQSPALERYSEIKDLIKSGKISPHQIGLYDNIGATLPLIILMMGDLTKHLTASELYDFSWSDEINGIRPLDHIYEQFVNLLGPKPLLARSAKRFSLYTKAEHLSTALHAGNIAAALGGGGWLIQPEKQITHPLTIGLPATHGGLLWVEGAAITSRTKHGPEIVKFLSKHLLKKDYQLSLATRTPYSSCPVTIEAIGSALNSQATARAIDEETRIIFTNTHQTNRLLVHRQHPNNMGLWSDLWKRIVQDFCHHCDPG